MATKVGISSLIKDIPLSISVILEARTLLRHPGGPQDRRDPDGTFLLENLHLFDEQIFTCTVICITGNTLKTKNG